MMKKLLLIAAVAAIGTLNLPAGTRAPAAFKGKIVQVAGAPNNGTNEVQTITFGSGISAGTFKLTFQGETTAAIAWSATTNTLVSNIDTALEALSGIGSGGVVTANSSLSSGIGDVTVTFSGTNVAKLNVSTMTVASQPTGGTVTVAETTPGVEADGRDSDVGALLVDTTNGMLYQNNGTKPNVAWAPVVQGDAGTITATATAGAATLNKLSGVVTSEALTTAAGSSYTLTLTNSKIAATSRVFASVQNGTNTRTNLQVGAITPGAGSCTIDVANREASNALNGTIKIGFLVVP